MISPGLRCRLRIRRRSADPLWRAQAIIDNPDLAVVTPAGRERRSAKAIGDVFKLKKQTNFFTKFFDPAQIV